MKKLLSTPMIIKKDKTDDKQKVGDISKQYIEENKQILEQQKLEAINNNEQTWTNTNSGINTINNF